MIDLPEPGWKRVVPLGWWAVCEECGGLIRHEDRCPECWEEAEEARHDKCCPMNEDNR